MEYVKDFGAIIALLIYYSITEYKKLQKKKGKKSNFLNATYLAMEINKILQEVRIITGSNRVHIMTFSNSEETLTGRCYYYMSMKYEDTDDHTKPIIHQYQKLPCMQFASTQAKIHQDGLVYIGEDDKSKLGKYHASIGIKSAYKFRIGNTIANGILGISYYETNKRLTNKQKDFVLGKLLELETILNL